VKGSERRGRNGAQRAPAGEGEVVRKRERKKGSRPPTCPKAEQPNPDGRSGKREEEESGGDGSRGFQGCRRCCFCRARPERAEEEKGPVRA
jgi:hypothetical protein